MKEYRNRLLALCVNALSQKGLTTQRYKDRLMREIKEIDGQTAHEFILELYDKLKAERKIYPENQMNSLVYELLDIAVPADISKPPMFDEGESPDIDIDYLGPIRDHLKHKWAPEVFGRENVCSIGNYTTFGIKSAFIDMAKVFSCDRDEIMALTTKLGLKDEDGKALTFDKALEEYPELNAYCERNPDVADAVKKCLHRNRGMGVHAGGLIVSSKRIDNLVPLVRGKEDAPVSAWVEGLHGQDLGPMGLIKFDLLVITNLLQIALCCKLIKERHGLKYICSDPAVNRDWSDTAYLDDPLAIALANAGDLLGIFQFDSPGIRKLAKGNVTGFDDLMAYSAIYRPGPLGMGMHDRYIARKNGKEEFTLHPILQPILGSTYGVMVYQEQVMQILNAVGEIPLKDCELVRKAISKKQVAKFAKYKGMFLENGQRTLSTTVEELEILWSQIESFAEYGFNKSHSCAYTYISSRLLYLKAHYPIEFYTATLQCEKTTEKIKEYMIDARRRGIEIERVDINKSQENFCISAKDNGSGESIYYGFAKLKGLGEDVALRIVANQKYGSFEEFLQRFGTDAKVLTALVSLGAFGYGNRIDLFKFYEHYKDWIKKVADRDKRHEQSKERHHQKLYEELQKHIPRNKLLVGFSDDHYAQYEAAVTFEGYDDIRDSVMKSLDKLRNAYFKCIETHAKKKENDELPTFADFIADAFNLDEKWETMLSQPMEIAENAYYGFRWTHPLERSPDYSEEKRRTFHMHRQAVDEGSRTGYVEVEIEKVEQKPTKKGGIYYLLTLSDAMGEVNRCNVWEDDFKRFDDMLLEGNLVKLMLDAPDAGFPTYKLHSPPRHLRHKLPTKNMDFRVIVYRKSEEDSA